LPDFVRASYVVPLERVPGDIKGFIIEATKDFVPFPTRQFAIDRLNASVVTVNVGTGVDYPNLRQSIASSTDNSEIRSALDTAKHFVVFQSYDKPNWPIYFELSALGLSAALAARLNSIVVDITIPLVMSPQQALTRLPVHPKVARLADWLKVESSPHRDGCWMTTNGLYRFGLPELQTIGVPPQIERQWATAMTGLAWKIIRILQAHSAANDTLKLGMTHLELPVEIEVNTSNIAEAYDRDATRDGKTTLLLSADAQHCFLTVTQRRGDRRSIGEYLTDSCKKLFGSMEIGSVQRPHSQLIEKAVSTARTGLADIRQRFLAHELPVGGKLIVKFQAPGDRIEYLWSFVTNWDKPDTLEGYCGNNSIYDPNLCAGQSLRLQMNSIVDWAVVVDDEIVEGGWTTRASGH